MCLRKNWHKIVHTFTRYDNSVTDRFNCIRYQRPEDFNINSIIHDLACLGYFCVPNSNNL